jgi:steroid Delta-isomerase
MSVELFERHVERFNQGVRSGDFSAMLEQFADDAELEFVGVPVGPFSGKDAIAAAYAEQPPDGEVDVLDVREEEGVVIADYAWRQDDGRRAGRMLLTPDDGRIAKLVVTFE